MTEQFVRDRQRHREQAAHRTRMLKLAGHRSLFQRLVAVWRRRPNPVIPDEVIDLRGSNEAVTFPGSNPSSLEPAAPSELSAGRTDSMKGHPGKVSVRDS